jgi:hypothetical protein
MNEDIRKNIVDESGKNSDNIVDIEAFAGSYEADAEFENLIKNGLNESWDDLGLSVSDDLIARTMDAIKNADESAKAFPVAEAPVRTARESTETAAAPVKNRSAKYRRFARIAAGIAAAALIGIFGIGVLKSGLFFSKKSADSASYDTNSNSAPMSMAASDNSVSDSKKSESWKSDAGETAADSILDMIGANNAAEDGYFEDSQITASTGSWNVDKEADGDSLTEGLEPMATAAPDFSLDSGSLKAMEPQTSTDLVEDIVETDESDESDGTAFPDINAVLLDMDEEEQAVILKEYIESVRGELLDTAVETSYPEDTDAILFSAVWSDEDTDSAGLFTRCDIYGDRVVYSHGSVLDHIAPDFTVEEYSLEDGETVAAELLRLSGGATE